MFVIYFIVSMAITVIIMYPKFDGSDINDMGMLGVIGIMGWVFLPLLAIAYFGKAINENFIHKM